MESLKEKTAKGLFWGALNNVLMQLIGVIVGIALGRLLNVIAVSLVNSDSEKYDTNRFIGDSYRDLTRIAKINEDLWAELFMGNKKNLLKMIQQFERELDIIKDALNSNDLGTLKEKFIISTKRREKID